MAFCFAAINSVAAIKHLKLQTMPEQSFLRSTSLEQKRLTILDGDLKMTFNLRMVKFFQ